MSGEEQAFRPIKRRRLSDEVTAQIRARIAAGEIGPGDKLPAERQMAERFGVSRGAVREALRSLELAGVIEMRHGVQGGAFVTHGVPGVMSDNLKDLFHLKGVTLDELTEARVWIETLVSRLACERATEDDLANLEANVDEAEALFRAGRYDDKIDVQVEFHNILARATHNPVMEMLMAALMEVMRDFSHAVGGERNDLTLKARRRFLTLLRARDGEGAAEAMRTHVEQLHRRYARAVRDRDSGSKDAMP